MVARLFSGELAVLWAAAEVTLVFAVDVYVPQRAATRLT